MKRYFILVLVVMMLTSCSDVKMRSSADRKAEQRRQEAFRSSEACFAEGGVEYQYGSSGSGGHRVCIYRNNPESRTQ